jgi:hypothetical protein
MKYHRVAHANGDNIDPYSPAYYHYLSPCHNVNYASSLPSEQVSS